jgi:hypothetical protein
MDTGNRSFKGYTAAELDVLTQKLGTHNKPDFSRVGDWVIEGSALKLKDVAGKAAASFSTGIVHYACYMDSDGKMQFQFDLDPALHSQFESLYGKGSPMIEGIIKNMPSIWTAAGKPPTKLKELAFRDLETPKCGKPTLFPMAIKKNEDSEGNTVYTLGVTVYYSAPPAAGSSTTAKVPDEIVSALAPTHPIRQFFEENPGHTLKSIPLMTSERPGEHTWLEIVGGASMTTSSGKTYFRGIGTFLIGGPTVKLNKHKFLSLLMYINKATVFGFKRSGRYAVEENPADIDVYNSVVGGAEKRAYDDVAQLTGDGGAKKARHVVEDDSDSD